MLLYRSAQYSMCFESLVWALLLSSGKCLTSAPMKMCTFVLLYCFHYTKYSRVSQLPDKDPRRQCASFSDCHCLEWPYLMPIMQKAINITSRTMIMGKMWSSFLWNGKHLRGQNREAQTVWILNNRSSLHKYPKDPTWCCILFTAEQRRKKNMEMNQLGQKKRKNKAELLSRAAQAVS